MWSTEAELDLQNRLSRLPFYAPAGFGGAQFGNIVDDIQALVQQLPGAIQSGSAALAQLGPLIEKAGPYLQTVYEILQDPAMPQIMTRVETIKALLAKKSPSAPTPAGTPSTPTDLKLYRAVPYLDSAIYVLKNPWVPWVAGTAAFLVLGGIGFAVGRLTARRKPVSPVTGYRRRRRR